MTFSQFLDIFRARRKLVLLVLGVTVLTALIISLLLPKQYTATTSVVIDVKSPDPVAGMVMQGMIAPGYMATQVDILNSDRVALRVVKLLGFDKNPVAIDQWKTDGEGEGTLEGYYVALLQKKLEIIPSRDSNVIEVNYSASDPKFAAAVANSFARAYIETAIELRTEPARQYGAWFEERLKGLRTNLEKAQSRLSDYQQEKGIIVTDDRMMDDETARLTQLTTELATIQGQTADATGRQKSGPSDLSQEVLLNPLIQGIKSDITKAESSLSEMQSKLGKNHPQVHQLIAQINEMRAQLREEIARISGGAAVARRTGNAKEDELKQQIEKQKQLVLKLKSQRDELAVLVNDVATARHAYETVGQRMIQSNLEGQTDQTNVLVLSTAAEPTKPSRPRVLLNVMASFFLGIMLAVGITLARELTDRRVRSVEDMTSGFDLPVLTRLDSAVSPELIRAERSWRHPFTRLRTRRKPASPRDKMTSEPVTTKSVLGFGHGIAVKSTLIPNKSVGVPGDQLINQSGKSIGTILIDSGRLTPEAAEQILSLQRQKNMRFGDAAIQMGLLTRDDIQEVLAQQYDYAYLTPGDGRLSEDVVAAFKPFSPVVEQLRDLRSQLVMHWFNAETHAPLYPKAITVVSPGRAEGRSFVAANLAVVFSQMGKRTLLIDADLRNPTQHDLFQLSDKLGLSTLLAGRVVLSKVIIPILGLNGLCVLPAGPIPPNPQELLNRPLFGALIQVVSDKFDMVVVDTSAGSESSDCKTIATRTLGTFMVVRKNITLLPQANDLVASLQHAGVAVVGTVLNNG